VSRQPGPDDAAIGGRLRQGRTEARITQAQAAAVLGIPRSAVSDLEAGTRRLTAVELARCADLYRHPENWFLGRAPGPARPAALARLVATLPAADQEAVTRFAEFLATRRAATTREFPGGATAGA
jgi:transcriptional regulator with XRE-family HTH domain